MRRLNVTVYCKALYNSGIDVPEDMTLEEAIEYAKQHLADIQCGVLEFVDDIAIDEDNCDFEK